MRRRKARQSVVAGVVLALGALAPSGAWGDEVVVTGTRTPEASQRAAVRVDVVTREEAERRGASNVAEALMTQPGVRVAPGDYGYLGGVSGLQIQGFDRDRVLILEDGERVIGDVGGAIDLSTLPTTDLARIEIVTGPQSALYGASAIGGVVNILTGPPALQGGSGRLRMEGRSGGGLVTQGTAALREGDSWMRADVGATRQGEVAPGGGQLLPQVWRYQAGVRAGTRLGERWSVRGRARWFRDDVEGRESRVVPGLGVFAVSLPERNDRYAMQAVAERDMGGGSGLRVSAASQVYDGQSDKQTGGAVERRMRGYHLDSVEPVGTLADGARTWVLGGRYESERFAQQLERVTPGTAGASVERVDEVPEVARSSGALYGQLVWKLSPRLTMLPGVRHELHSRHGQSTSPRVSVSYRPASRLHLRAGAGRGYRVPSAKELGFVFDHSFYGYRVEGNTALSPESSWGANADATFQGAGGVTLRGGVFGNRIERMIDLDLGHPLGRDASGVTTYTYRNRGQATTAGGQLSLVVRRGEGLRTELAYDRLWTRDDSTGAPIAGRPMHALTAALRAALPLGAALDVRWRAFSDAYVDGLTRSPGYQTLDARLARALWPGSEAYVGVRNALDERRDPSRLNDLRPPLGRVIYLGLRADFPAEEP